MSLAVFFVSLVSSHVSELDHVLTAETSTQLRARLRAARDTIASVFIRLDGLAVEPTATHAAMQQYLRRAGLGDELVGPTPTLVALDWTCVEGCPAEGLALFGVLARVLQQRGRTVIICGPMALDLAAVVAESGLQQHSEPAIWISCDANGVRKSAPITPALLFRSPALGPTVTELLMAVETVMLRHSAAPDAIDLTTSLLMELLQNVGTHAAGAWASVVAVIHSRRRPAVLEIGMADSGDGLPKSVLSGPRLRWLVPLCDASILEAFVANGVTSRPIDSGGGALRDVVLKFLDVVPAGVVLIRSGSALIRLDRALARSIRPTQLSYGFGTQIRLEIPLVSS